VTPLFFCFLFQVLIKGKAPAGSEEGRQRSAQVREGVAKVQRRGKRSVSKTLALVILLNHYYRDNKNKLES